MKPSAEQGLAFGDYPLAWSEGRTNELLRRVTHDPDVMTGKPCIRGMRVTVGMIVGLLASGQTVEGVLEDYPYLERDDVYAALAYAAELAMKDRGPASPS
jgi:uncharacterized protein (DUF433 family)